MGLGGEGILVRVGAAFALLSLAMLLFFSFDARSDGMVLCGGDVVFYCSTAVSGGGPGLPNPHHLLGHYLAYALDRAGLVGRDGVVARIRAHRILACLATALKAWLVFRLLSRRSSAPIAAGLALLAALTAGPWTLAAAGENVPFATAMLVWLLVFLIERRLDGRAAPVLATAAIFLLALLGRQDSVLVLPALFLLLPWRRALLVTAVAGLASLALYRLAWGLWIEDMDFGFWLTKLARTGQWGRMPDGEALVQAGAQQLAAFLGRAGQDLAAQFGFLLIAIAAVVVARPRPGGAPGRVLLALAVFLAARILFGLWWEPVNIEVWTPNVVIVLMILGLAMASGRTSAWTRRLALPLVTAVAIVNAVLVIAPLRGHDYRGQIEEIESLAGPKAVIVPLDFGLVAACRTSPRSPAWVSEEKTFDAVYRASLSSEVEPLRRWTAGRLKKGECVVLVRDRIKGATWGPELVSRLAGVLGQAPLPAPNGEPWLISLRP